MLAYAATFCARPSLLSEFWQLLAETVVAARAIHSRLRATVGNALDVDKPNFVPRQKQDYSGYQWRRLQIRVLSSGLCVQQPCSNPGEYPEMLRQSLGKEYVCLQGCCKPQKPTENYSTYLTRKRSVVRIHYRPL